ncbi:MAG TPA: biotin/lipoyl-binding protein [Chitinophagaceae bacterium]|jgi:HlyD family secretion protein|nr:biotin/lipoyl-binding protein [Chitinophagaceae bacterium]HMU56685.1 biotin/lipoyl-binding protein [Chitinophagaceae bacterium]
MTNNVNILTAFIAMLLLTACNSEKKNTEALLPQGKVKIESIAVAPKIGGRIEKIFVSEGQTVQKGDTLAIISIPELNAKMEQVSGALLSAEGQLELAVNGATTEQLQQIQSQLDAANAQLDLAEKSFSRIQNMFNDSLVPAQQYDEVKSKYNSAVAQVNAVKAKQKEIINGTRPETIRSAKGQLTRALGAKNEVLTAATERFLIAPADMVIESITLKEGELALPGYSLFNGEATGSTFFRFTINEKEINRYKTGQQVVIKSTGDNRVISAIIKSVSPLPKYADNTSVAPNREVGESFFEMKISPANPADAQGLYNNTTVFLEK